MKDMVHKKPLFSVTRKDLRVDTFRGSGPGGQNRNKRDTGVRITHIQSGAIGESCEERSQLQNRNAAFHKLIESSKFKVWVQLTTAVVMQGFRDIENKMEYAMQPRFLKVEELTTYTCNGCKKSGTTQDGKPPKLWGETEDEDVHYCPKCLRNRQSVTEK
jgi:hypothetical protein